MTIADELAALPPFPEKPEHMPGLWWEYYYRDLAAAWESRARLLRDSITHNMHSTTHYEGCDEVHYWCRVLKQHGPLPKKEG